MRHCILMIVMVGYYRYDEREKLFMEVELHA